MTQFTQRQAQADAHTQKIEARVFQRLLAHLDANKDVQNIDMMIHAQFCRNCIARWYQEAASAEGIGIEYEQAREIVYGMPYQTYKERYQKPATTEQLDALKRVAQ